MSAMQKTLWVLVACVALVLGLTVFKVLNVPAADRKAQQLDAGIVMLQTPRPLPKVQLLDQNAQPRLLSSLTGQWSLVFFGYTFCPDVCPTTLAELRHIKSKLSPKAAAQVQLVMVSVDPARDTPAQLKTYLSFFDANLLGLTGEPVAIAEAAKAMGVPYIAAPTDQGENYLVDHGANLALVDPQGRQQGFIRAPLRTDKLAEELERLLAP